MLISVACLSGCSPDFKTINVSASAFYPASLATNAEGLAFLVGSLTRGEISRIDLEGNLSPFANDKTLISTTDLQADHRRNRLYVCISDTGRGKNSSPETQNKLAALGIYELSSGQRLSTIELSKGLVGSHGCSDLTSDFKGNIYVADGPASLIYQVAPDNQSRVLLRDQQTLSGLSAIVYHKQENLIITKNEAGAFYRIPTLEPEKTQKINLTPVAGPGKLLLIDQKRLLVIRGREVQLVESPDNFISAKTIYTYTGAAFKNLAAATIGPGGQVFLLNAKQPGLNNRLPTETDQFSIHSLK